MSHVFVNYAVLAAWFRLKYHHVAIGALASSAPLLYFDNITPASAYHDVITRDFQVNQHSYFLSFMFVD
jgi:lysosomal Pro-X carboxypeptidase